MNEAGWKILRLCSRATIWPERTSCLKACSRAVNNWHQVLEVAEQQGVSPLLHWHLEGVDRSLPDETTRALHLLMLRHRWAGRVLSKVLAETMASLQQAGLEVLVLKGAALAHTVYPDIGLRPMRDIDLLLTRQEANEARKLLLAQGFIEPISIPKDHFHLPPLQKNVDGLLVGIELHHGLFPNLPPYYPRRKFAELFGRAIPFTVNGITAWTLGNEDMIWHLYEHGLHMPLVYESFRLVAVADLITLVEFRLDEIDLKLLTATAPRASAALPLLHHLTPWQDRVQQRFSWKQEPAPASIGQPFQGWPHHRLPALQGKSLLNFARNTLVPPEWWCRIYYGVQSKMQWYWCFWVLHPLHILWWVGARIRSCFCRGRTAG